MQNLNEDYKKFIEELKSKVNDNTIPEFGNFPPISVNTILKDDSALVFQVKSVDKYPQKKEFLTNFINAKTGGMVTSTRFFDDKKKLLEYINTIDDKALNKIVLNLKADTE